MHSLHAYFLRRGDFNSPIVYEVDRALRRQAFLRRGAWSPFSTARQIFNMSASFQSPETGLDHQIPMPDVPPPESLPDIEAHYRDIADKLPPARAASAGAEAPVRISPGGAARSRAAATNPPPLKHVWFRAVDKLPDDEALHRCLLAYVSDFHLLDTALQAARRVADFARQLVIASIDHAMWFHRSVRVDDWLLYAIDSPSASGARGFTRGSVFARDGRLVASAAQEGLIRVTA